MSVCTMLGSHSSGLVTRAVARLLCVFSLGSILATLATTCVPPSQREPDFPALACSSVPSSWPDQRANLSHAVVVAIDGVRWQEIFRGTDPGLTTGNRVSAIDLVPEIHRLARTRGVLLGGDENRVFVSSPSTVSLPGYSELFSGRTPKCTNNHCAATREPTLLDDWRAQEGTATFAVVSSWSRIPAVAAADRAPLMISAGRLLNRNLEPWRSDTALDAMIEQGGIASASPGNADYRPDRFTAEIGLRLLELVKPSFLFLGLGDTDEHAHNRSYPAYLDALRFADRVVRRVDDWLMEQQRLGKRTLLVVTTDHGRGAGFYDHGNSKEAARIWMLWAGDAIRARGYPISRDARLADLSPTIRARLGLTPICDRQAGRDLAATLARSTVSEVNQASIPSLPNSCCFDRAPYPSATHASNLEAGLMDDLNWSGQRSR